jgi:hypothetical protein
LFLPADAGSQWARSSEQRRADIELQMAAAAAAGDVAAAGECMQARAASRLALPNAISL